jgi:putative acetyltransferase
LSVNIDDYSLEQVTLWASAKEPLLNWQNKITTQYFLVAKINDQIVGFSSLAEATGYVDVLYVHKDFQRRGIAKKLLQSLEARANLLQIAYLYTEASITAKPFFEKQGFFLQKEQDKIYKNLVFRNYIMGKHLV